LDLIGFSRQNGHRGKYKGAATCYDDIFSFRSQRPLGLNMPASPSFNKKPALAAYTFVNINNHKLN
jgi:hypothetical protein